MSDQEDFENWYSDEFDVTKAWIADRRCRQHGYSDRDLFHAYRGYVQAARAQQAGSGEAVAWLCLWPDGTPWGAVTDPHSVEIWLRKADEGRTVQALYTHPSASVPGYWVVESFGNEEKKPEIFIKESEAKAWAAALEENGWEDVKVHPAFKDVAPQHTSASVPNGAWEALQRLIENGGQLGPSSRDDALLVAKYRRDLLATTPQPAGDEPDLFWDFENPEDTGQDCAHDLADYCAQDLPAGETMVVTVMCAKMLPNRQMEIWVDDDGDLQWDWMPTGLKRPNPPAEGAE